MKSFNWKFFLAGLCAFAICTSSATAAILYQSPLTAPPLTAGNLVGQDGWVNHSGTGSFIQVGASGATVAHGSGSREDANVPLPLIGAGQTYYFGFDAVVTGSSANVYFAHFKDAGTGTDFTTRVHVTAGPGGSDFTYGLSATASAAPDASFATGFAFGSTNRLVGSYQEGTNEIKLWVNPTDMLSTSLSLTDPAAHATAAFALRQAGVSSTQVVSNLIVATTFNQALTGVPEPSSIALMFLSLGAMLIRRK